MPRSARHDRFRGVADRFHIIAGIEESDDAAGTGFQPLITPGERADQRPLVEHELDVAAEILGVQQPFLERPAMKWKNVGRDPTSGFFVAVFKNSAGICPSPSSLLAA